MTRKQRIEKATAKRFAARTKRQALAAKRRITALKGHLTRVKKYLPEALMVFEVCPWMEEIYRQRCREAIANPNLSAKEANKVPAHFNTLIKTRQAWRRIMHSVGSYSASAKPMGEAKHVPKSRNSLLDWPRVGPMKEGGRIPLGLALTWHMTDDEVEHWNQSANNYKGIRSISNLSRSHHFGAYPQRSWINRKGERKEQNLPPVGEPLTYCEALRRYALEQHWRDAENTLHDTFVKVMEIANRDLRRSAHRKETDGRKLRKKNKFTARTRKAYWTWLLKQLHTTHKHRWPKERKRENIFPARGAEILAMYSDNSTPYKSTRIKQLDDNN